MNRKVIVLAIVISLFALIGVATYAVVTDSFGMGDKASEVGSEVPSETTSEADSEVIIESPSEITKDPNEGVDTQVPVTDSEVVTEPEGDPNEKYDANGDLRENSKYLDEDGDTVANYYDICPGVDDFGIKCSANSSSTTDNSSTADNSAATNSSSTATETSQTQSNEVDANGDLVSNSKYLDADGDTIANYYDICPGVDDFGSSCETDAYDKQ